MSKYPRVAKLNSAEKFLQHLRQSGIQLPFDETILCGADAPLAQPVESGRHTIGNRFCILPMEGWDGTTDGRPTELTRRRWPRFGQSGAKLIWGGEAVAIRADGRANPNQLMINESTFPELESLRNLMVAEHCLHHGSDRDLCVGLQLTHSGRFARPNSKSRLEPQTVYRHPLLDRKFNVPPSAIISDDDLDQLIEDIVAAAKWAEKAGFEWVDIKHCHGYLGHELLSGYDRPGKFGGSFENRTRFLRDTVSGIRSATELKLGVRLSAFDFVPFAPGSDRVGRPETSADYGYAFGSDGSGISIDLDEPKRFLELLRQLGIELLCTTAGSPYYTPHIQRPATFPPSDGYLPPEDPLAGVARQIHVTAELKREFPDLIVVGSGYSYLQDWLPNVAQAAVSQRMVDCVGLGRMVLSYPELPADVLAGKSLQRKKICRTFSDCTTAPRNGLVSGCYPLDDYYKRRDDANTLIQLKKQQRHS